MAWCVEFSLFCDGFLAICIKIFGDIWVLCLVECFLVILVELGLLDPNKMMSAGETGGIG